MKETKACGCSGFTLPMAALDAVPVLLFSGSGAVLSELFGGGLFSAGSWLCSAAGWCKVGWKTLLALEGSDVKELNSAFHVLVPAGFALMLAGAASHPGRTAGALRKLCGFPQCLWLGAACAGMAGLAVMSRKLDFTRADMNWLGELANAAVQGAVYRGLVLIK